MSKPRVMIQAVIDTGVHAQLILDFVVQELIGKNIFENHGVGFGLEVTDWIFSADVRFNSRADRDTVDAFLRNRALVRPQTRDWFKSVKANSHLCTHDDVEVKDCTTTEFVPWGKP